MYFARNRLRPELLHTMTTRRLLTWTGLLVVLALVIILAVDHGEMSARDRRDELRGQLESKAARLVHRKADLSAVQLELGRPEKIEFRAASEVSQPELLVTFHWEIPSVPWREPYHVWVVLRFETGRMSAIGFSVSQTWA